MSLLCMCTILFILRSFPSPLTYTAEESDYAMSDSAMLGPSSRSRRGRKSNALSGMFTMDLDEKSINNRKFLGKWSLKAGKYPKLKKKIHQFLGNSKPVGTTKRSHFRICDRHLGCASAVLDDARAH